MLIEFMYCIIRYNSDARTRMAGSEWYEFQRSTSKIFNREISLCRVRYNIYYTRARAHARTHAHTHTHARAHIYTYILHKNCRNNSHFFTFM